MRQIRALLALDRRTLLLFPEAFFFLGQARLQLRKPFAQIAPTLGARTAESPAVSDARHIGTMKAVATAIAIASRYTLWDSQCLVRAIAGMRMLERRRIPSTLYLGTAKDEEGKLIAHAWLRSGSLYISGADVMRRFVVVETFANDR